MPEGIVVRAVSGFYDVLTPEGMVTARVRTILRKELVRATSANRKAVQRVTRASTSKPVTIGDRVRVEPIPGDPNMWVIEEVLPRRARFARAAAGQVPQEQVLVANLDQILIVFAAKNPEPNLRLVDRFLVAAESLDMPAVLVINKVELSTPAELDALFGHYPKIGYPVYYVSAKTGQGIDELHALLKDKISAFTGPSGVGKSSLINQFQPELALRVGEISESTGKGRHTTTAPQLYPLEEGGFLADTPGLRTLSTWKLDPEELPECFPEFRPYLGECKYVDCTHIDEEGCAIIAAVHEGAIDPRRYDSYQRLREGM